MPRIVFSSEFMRDPEQWSFLKQEALPELIGTRSSLSAWSVGCNAGQECYTLAMIFHEALPFTEKSILGTDVNAHSLEVAQRGGPYTAQDVQSLSTVQRSNFFQLGGPPFYVRPELMKPCTFRFQNMLESQFNMEFDLILFRNMESYFSDDKYQDVYQRLYTALRPGGFLFVSWMETSEYLRSVNFEVVTSMFYRRPMESRTIKVAS